MVKLKVAHTPDADDAFMFYAMTHDEIDTWLEIEHVIEDIESLNRKAFEVEYDVTAISAYAYSFLSDRYQILSSGASVGDGYGPIVVAMEEIDLRHREIAVPGRYTTANLLLNLAIDFKPVEMRFDEIIPAVKEGRVDAGLLIHEGQITYKDHNLVRVLDLWEWWHDKAKLPLPLGLNAIKRDLDAEVKKEFLRVMRESINYALKNVDIAMDYAMKYSRGLDKETATKFALMYVNRYTYEMPESVKKALELLYKMGEKKGLLKMPPLDIL
ncbi:1,4-dihydroxy-6-naphthoate synthase [Archaeoglobus sulfaticallidus PM70-1]|uniref:1,4-dihydroxy-6-naphtoate synthase n=1 Tax=Archaeoglobus sulfaticallidus PM70-1 TaxID=387631 RepID=N0BDA7_9EURY|nr:MqnA/MqnD/SBP family protein [Archaeoglobus sulfaticallidus]AGK60983.1 1,4-dihydroxy-6-naphthoate synthase [Archaeoglobus sulfaticallidus PM70-1]